MAKQNDLWFKANAAAKKKYGKSLNGLVTQRSKLKKGTDEYAVVQNAINDVMGSNKIHKTSSMKNEAVSAAKMGLESKMAKVGKQFIEQNEKNVDKNLDPITARMDVSLNIRRKAQESTKTPFGALEKFLWTQVASKTKAQTPKRLKKFQPERSSKTKVGGL